MYVATSCDCCGERTPLEEEGYRYFTLLITVPSSEQGQPQTEMMRVCEDCKQSLEATVDEETGQRLTIAVLSSSNDQEHHA